MTAAEQQKTVVLLVTLQFTSIEDRDELLAAFRPLAEHVGANEAEALIYESLVSNSDPLHVVIFERHASQAFLDSVHNQSAPFKAFIGGYLADDAPWRKDHSVQVSIQSFSETGIGHMAR